MSNVLWQLLRDIKEPIARKYFASTLQKRTGLRHMKDLNEVWANRLAVHKARYCPNAPENQGWYVEQMQLYAESENLRLEAARLEEQGRHMHYLGCQEQTGNCPYCRSKLDTPIRLRQQSEGHFIVTQSAVAQSRASIARSKSDLVGAEISLKFTESNQRCAEADFVWISALIENYGDGVDIQWEGEDCIVEGVRYHGN